MNFRTFEFNYFKAFLNNIFSSLEIWDVKLENFWMWKLIFKIQNFDFFKLKISILFLRVEMQTKVRDKM